MADRAGTDVGLEDRGVGLLDLQDQVVPVPGHHQHGQGAGAHAADTDDLVRQAHERVAQEQQDRVRAQRLQVLAEQGGSILGDPLMLGLVDGHEQRGRGAEPAPAVDDLGELAHRDVAGGLRRGAPGPLGVVGQAGALERLDQVLDVDAGVPDLHGALLGQRGDRGAVGGDGGPGRGPDLLGLDPDVPPGDGHTGGQPLDVPLERPGQGLVEVVEVEHQPPVRGGEHPEVGDMGIPAQLGADRRARPGGQVGGHHGSRSAQERERRGAHPLVPQRDQPGLPGALLGVQQGKGVPVRGQHQVRMRIQGGLDPGRLARREAGGPVRARLGERAQGQVGGLGAVIGHDPRVPASTCPRTEG